MTAWDPSSDYEVFDATQAVTFRSLTSGALSDAGAVTATWTEVAISKALKRQVSLRAVEAGGGRLKMGDALWALSEAELGAVVPKEGDQVREADGTIWRVVATDRKPAVSMYRVYGRR